MTDEEAARHYHRCGVLMAQAVKLRQEAQENGDSSAFLLREFGRREEGAVCAELLRTRRDELLAQARLAEKEAEALKRETDIATGRAEFDPDAIIC